MADRIIEFEGRRISVPQDATDAEVATILGGPPSAAQPPLTGALAAAQAAQAGIAPPPAPKTDEQKILDAINGPDMALERGVASALNSAPVSAAGQFARGARKGVANLAGLPVDAVNNAPRLLNLIPGVEGVGPISDAPVGGSDWVDKSLLGMGGLIPEPPAPRNMTERVFRRVGEETGAAAVPVAGALGAAGRMTVQQARELPALSRMFVEPAKVAPAQFLRDNATAAVAAGTGASIANESTGNVNKETGAYDPGMADIAGALGGVTLSGILSAIARPVGTAVSALVGRPSFTDGVVRDVAVDEIARAAGLAPNARGVVNTDPLVEAIAKGRRVGDTIPGYQESLADRTKNPGLAALEYSRQSGGDAGTWAQQRATNVKAVDEAMTAVKPQETPGALRAELEVQRNNKLTSSQQSLEQAQAQFDDAARALEPMNPNAEARGATIRSGIENAERAAREVERAAYEGIGGAVNPAPVAEAFSKVAAQVPEAYQPLLAGVQDAIGIPGNAKGPLDVREIIALRSRLTTEQRNAARGPQPDDNKARMIGQFVDALDETTAQSLAPDTLAQWQKARDISRGVNERFNRPGDPVAAALARNEGRAVVPDSGVGQRFIQPDRGQASNIDRVLAQTDLTAQGRDVFDALKDEVRADAMRLGVTQKPERAAKFVQDYGRATERLGVKQDVERVAETGRAAQQARQADEALKRELGVPGENAGTGQVGKYLRYGDEKADLAMRGVMADANPAKAADDLLNFANNEAKAVEGARRSFWNVMESKTRSSGATTKTVEGTQPWRPTDLKQFLDDPANSAVAERLYRDNPEHLKRIREIADTLQGTNVASAAKAPNTSGTPQGLKGGALPSGETIASRIFAVERGVVSPTFAALNLVGIAARRATKAAQMKAVQQAIDKALTDPDWAAMLLKENNPANKAAIARSAKGWMGNEASTFINLMDEDEDAPIKQKVMEK